MTYLKLKTLCALVFLIPTLLIAQDNTFNNFKTTKASGEAPAIFTTSLNDKVAVKVASNSEISEEYIENYALYSNYALNNLLESGIVLYGDPMTRFVQKVAANLLKNEPKLKEELQFYVIKTNITNALCTDPGAIFITTGLISQIENEAQLAYVIAHEIVHYQEKHLEKSFNKSKESNLDPSSSSSSSSYEDLVLQSKDHEFEADANALKLYHAAGYSDIEINTVFDVLMYSYLTFDEIDIDKSFFGNSKIYIPQSYFPENPNPILASEDYDDSKSSHPNIRKRKDAIAAEIKKYDNWKKNSSFIAIEEFKQVQNIARFESVRGDLLRADYVKALYDIYILENQFPNNEYLQTSKALAWSTISQTIIAGKKRTFLEDIDKKEGAISMLYSFISKLSYEEVALLAIRQTHDIYLKFPESKRIKDIRNETIALLAYLRNFEINKLESISFLDAVSLREESMADTASIDTLDIEGETKYDRIRRIREQQSSKESTAELIDEKFSTFLLYDLVANREFNEIYEKEKEKLKDNSRSSLISKRKRKKQKKEKNKKLEGDIILLTPHLEANKKGEFNLNRTLKFYDLMSKEIKKDAPKGRLQYRGIVLDENFTTEEYNTASLLHSYLIQMANFENREFKNQLIDYEDMHEFLEKYDNPQLVLISGKANKSSIFRNHLFGQAEYIEVSTGKTSSSGYYSVNYKIRQASVGGLVYEIFSKF